MIFENYYGDDKAPERKALLARCGFNILLPSVFGHTPQNKLPKGLELQYSLPSGSMPLTAQLDILHNIDDWIKQPIIYFDKEYTFQDIIKLLANIDGAHSDTQQRIEDVHSPKKSGHLFLIENDQITYDLIYKICAFILTWLAEYEELTEVFPVLSEYKGKYTFNYLSPGFIPNWCKKTGSISIKTKNN